MWYKGNLNVITSRYINQRKGEKLLVVPKLDWHNLLKGFGESFIVDRKRNRGSRRKSNDPSTNDPIRGFFILVLNFGFVYFTNHLCYWHLIILVSIKIFLTNFLWDCMGCTTIKLSTHFLCKIGKGSRGKCKIFWLKYPPRGFIEEFGDGWAPHHLSPL